MRNPVARHDHNRAATHQDRSKRPQQTVDEGLLDFYAENAENVAQSVYRESCSRVVGMTPDDSDLVPMEPGEIYIAKAVRILFDGKEVETFPDSEQVVGTVSRKPFPGIFKSKCSAVFMIQSPSGDVLGELLEFFQQLEQSQPSII